MANIINGTSTGAGGLITTGDSSDELQLQTAETARVTLTNTAVVVNEDGNDVDFRVEGDTDANLLVVDASADKVGVGTNSPTAKLNIIGSSDPGTIRLGTSKTDATRKFASISAEHYSSAEEPLAMIIADSQTSTSIVSIGGSFSSMNAANTINFYTAANNTTVQGTERMRIDSSGNVGIGVTPSAWTSYKVQDINTRGLGVAGGTDAGAITVNAYYDSPNWKYKGTSSYGVTLYGLFDGAHTWYNAPSGTAGNAISFTQAMTLDASGNLLVGKTSAAAAGNGNWIGPTGETFHTIASGNNTLHVYSSTASAYRFYVTNAGTVFATNTTISAISDQRLKENIRDLDVGLAEIMQLQPRVFDWKEGKGKDIQNDRGFIAQEFEQVFPNLVDEWKDPSPEGEEPYKSVRQDLIPVLVKAIQELKAELDTVKAELATLKG